MMLNILQHYEVLALLPKIAMPMKAVSIGKMECGLRNSVNFKTVRNTAMICVAEIFDK